MKGVFTRKKFNVSLFLLFLCGLFFVGMYIFVNIVDSTATSETLSFLFVGMLICLFVILSWFLNYRAFFHISDNSIQARYHWFGKLECNISDVDFAHAQLNTLTIQLKNGKCHTIMGIENSWELCSAILRKIPFETTEQPEKLIKTLNKTKSAKKKNFIYAILGIVLMFVNIFITVFLTDGKDINEFGKIDWFVMAVMGTIEIATVVVTFCFAHNAGKADFILVKLHYYIKRTIIETNLPMSYNAIKVFTEDSYSGLTILSAYPNSDAVYYSLHIFASDYTLIKAFESEVYENIDSIPGDFEALIDITEKVLH